MSLSIIYHSAAVALFDGHLNSSDRLKYDLEGRLAVGLSAVRATRRRGVAERSRRELSLQRQASVPLLSTCDTGRELNYTLLTTENTSNLTASVTIRQTGGDRSEGRQYKAILKNLASQPGRATVPTAVPSVCGHHRTQPNNLPTRITALEPRG